MKRLSFSPDEFHPTQCYSALEKAEFATRLVDFMESDFPRSKFTKSVYTHLSSCFGHIAEFNRDGFYSVWFDGVGQRVKFFDNLLRFQPYGDPEYTFSDVEKRIQKYVRDNRLDAPCRAEYARAVEMIERDELARLKAKYEG